MDTPNHDNLIDFYAAHKLEQARANYKLLAGAIASDSVKFLDYEDFWEDPASLNMRSWMYIATPTLRHPLQKAEKNRDNEKDDFIQFLPIPPLHDKFYNSKVSGQAIPTIDNLLFRKLILCASEYQTMTNARLGDMAKNTKEEIQSLFTLITTFYQHKKIDSWWELTELAGVDTSYSVHEEWLPPLIKSPVNISERHKENSSFEGIRNTIMPDNDNVLFIFDEYIMHLTLSTSESVSMLASQFSFCCIRGEYCVFYHEDGFLHYFWKEKRWNSDLAGDTEYILLSPEDDDHIFHLQKKLALQPPDLMDRAIIKAKDPTGNFGLIMDKEAHGGIYDLRTLSKVVDTGQLNWYDHAEEIILTGLKDVRRGSRSKIAAFWVSSNQYKLLAYGKIIVNNKLIRNSPYAVRSASFSPDGSYLALVGDEKGFVLETATYRSVMDFE